MCLDMKVFIFYLLGIVMLGGVTPARAAVRRYRFEVMHSAHTRLCTNKTMLTVNGQFPGPTIYARRGDLVIVDVINSGDRNITLHWHGVKMPRYPWSDGANFVTQCPISPGTSFSQRIILSDEEGTLWWHAHSDWTRATVYGAIIILPPKGRTYPFPKPHAEVPILLGEWWNADVQDILDEFYARGRDSNVSDAFTINSQPGALYPCSTQDMYRLRVEPGKTYLIRLVSAMLDYITYFRIANHNLVVVGTDGAYTKLLNSDYIAISPGQTIDFLLVADQPPSHYFMAAMAYARGGDYVPTSGILEYVGNYTPPSSPPFPSFPDYGTWAPSSLFFTQLRSLASDDHPTDVPINITQKLFFVLAVNHFPCTESTCVEAERLMTSVNNVSMVLPKDMDILQAYYEGIGDGVYTADLPEYPTLFYDFTNGSIARPESAYPQFGTAVKVLEYNATVEIVFQATNLHVVDHPIHLHGHSFYVVGSGYGNFDADRDPLNFNLVDPPLVETVTVPRTGWAVIRFKANNPGVWFMHCHFERHQSWGMKTAFIVQDGKAPDEKMLPPPPDMPRCGKLSSHAPASSSSVTPTGLDIADSTIGPKEAPQGTAVDGPIQETIDDPPQRRPIRSHSSNWIGFM